MKNLVFLAVIAIIIYFIFRQKSQNNIGAGVTPVNKRVLGLPIIA